MRPTQQLVVAALQSPNMRMIVKRLYHRAEAHPLFHFLILLVKTQVGVAALVP